MSNFKTYSVGYGLSVLLTLLAFGGVLMHNQNGHVFPTHIQLYVGFTVLAVAQLIVQLYFFLHVGKGQNKHWNSVILGLTLFIVTVVVAGTLWIMQNLKVNGMHNSPYIQNQINAEHSND
jgi:cytochrome o ubiquinol oxidase operon protein cyoD